MWLLAFHLAGSSQSLASNRLESSVNISDQQKSEYQFYKDIKHELKLVISKYNSTNNSKYKHKINSIYDVVRSLENVNTGELIATQLGKYVFSNLYPNLSPPYVALNPSQLEIQTVTQGSNKKRKSETAYISAIDLPHDANEHNSNVINPSSTKKNKGNSVRLTSNDQNSSDAPAGLDVHARDVIISAEQAEQERLAKITAQKAEQERLNKIAAEQAEQERLAKLATKQLKPQVIAQESIETNVINELIAEQKKLALQNKLLEEKILAFTQSQENTINEDRQLKRHNKLESNENPFLISRIEDASTIKNNTVSTALLYQASARTRLEQARLYIQSNKASQALKALQSYTPDENNRAEYHFLTGRAYQELKLNTKALSNYSIAIHLDFDHYKALNNRGLIKGALKDISGAMDDLNKSIQANPNYAPAYMNRGVTRAAMKKFDLAIEDFTKAIVLDPAYGDAYRNRGITYKFRGNINGACRDWLKASELGQSSTRAWFERHCRRK